MCDSNINAYRGALSLLRHQIDAALRFDDSLLVEMSPGEIERRKLEHPGAHFVIGEFEIKCTNPEKYHLCPT